MSTPQFQWPQFEVFAGATKDVRIKLYNADKTPAAIVASDVVRFKFKPTALAAPTLDLSTLGRLGGGSGVSVETLGVAGSVPAAVIIRFGQADTLPLTPGEWYGIVGVVVNAETNPDDAFKIAGYGTIILKPPPLGSLAIS